jgi:hypothetical protein
MALIFSLYSKVFVLFQYLFQETKKFSYVIEVCIPLRIDLHRQLAKRNQLGVVIDFVNLCY